MVAAQQLYSRSHHFVIAALSECRTPVYISLPAGSEQAVYLMSGTILSLEIDIALSLSRPMLLYDYLREYAL